jgi:hypothetical protein
MSGHCGNLLCLNACQRWYRTDHPDIQWFRRVWICQSCDESFIGAEVKEDFLTELVELRSALYDIKANAEPYSKESASATKSLVKLAKS